MENANHFRFEQPELNRRHFIRLGAAGAAALAYHPLAAGAKPAPQLVKALAGLEPYFTPQEDFREVARGKPLPHLLPDDQKRKAGLTRETWKLEVISDPDYPATIHHALTRKEGTAL